MSFPDVNVWFALLVEDHVHHLSAKTWWQADGSEIIAFSRVTQISLLRLLTTAAAMNNKPLTMPEAWDAYDRMFGDDRVQLLREPDQLEPEFRKCSAATTASPKMWADAYLVAFAIRAKAVLITFDQGLQNRGANCQVLGLNLIRIILQV